ncbi:hypothetical protein P152DRAFT_390900 [Eremomyces bilateralis CBS 781.70]|uniref:Uncharacterized protein n=1 Tax=Eremomyces bilateralis CBS 781.70 TaxID=1392243 RepID=A0A6G1GC67_9PEZI|nr:uncharacterized protein P152DRAFT_390900 [Eremomyces bilateralis CBS 781.70]KAF1815439.1 hypothetical protein P152DRAFT_390900 [Eremomyces bilateralis CBS 781.70]
MAAPQGRVKHTAIVRLCLHASHALGFQKTYNLPLFIIFAGAMVGFVLARFQYLDIANNFSKNSAPGEWYWHRQGHYRIGITLHLATCLPAGFLMVWQFVPVIRHKFLLFHRINGYIVIILLLLSNVGGLMIVRRTFGGSVATQSATGTLAILVSCGLAMAWWNIKCLQIDQHRKWMLRTMFYCGAIVTTRFILALSALSLTAIGSYFAVKSCDELRFMISEKKIAERYPTCLVPFNQSSIGAAGYAVVKADYNAGKESIAAALNLSFGTAVWLAIFLHLVGIEIYIHLTPAESSRLRQISYEKQIEAGMSNPGSAGLTADRFGDAPKYRT